MDPAKIPLDPRQNLLPQTFWTGFFQITATSKKWGTPRGDFALSLSEVYMDKICATALRSSDWACVW